MPFKKLMWVGILIWAAGSASRLPATISMEAGVTSNLNQVSQYSSAGFIHYYNEWRIIPEFKAIMTHTDKNESTQSKILLGVKVARPIDGFSPFVVYRLVSPERIFDRFKNEFGFGLEVRVIKPKAGHWNVDFVAEQTVTTLLASGSHFFETSDVALSMGVKMNL